MNTIAMISSSARRSIFRVTSRSSYLCTTIIHRSSVFSAVPSISSKFAAKHGIAPSMSSAMILQPKRTLSSMSLPRRGFPQYTLFGPSSALVFRAILPSFKRAGNDGVSVDKRGKLVLEFVPRNPSGTGFAWDRKSAFNLSPEEIGLCLSQLPATGIELAHSLYYGSGGGDDDDGVRQHTGDMIDKVLTIEPKEGATLLFKFDFVKNGVGGQRPNNGDNSSAPVEITLQAGEFECVKSIFQTSIPYLLGWNATMDLAAAAAVSKCLVGGGSGGGGPNTGGTYY